MARPLRIEYPGAFYHVTSRGNDQKDIFKSRKDREKFLDYLGTATERYGAQIHAFCLMSNHYQLLLETPQGNLSQIMRHINGAYTTYFNAKRKRAGHFFQGRYKALLVEENSYATELSRYIHLNPVRAGITEKPEDYPWSSYGGFTGKSKVANWMRTDFILGYFADSKREVQRRYRRFAEDPLRRDQENSLQATVASTLLGSPAFIHEIREKHLGQLEADRDIPAVKELSPRCSLELTIAAVERADIQDEGMVRKLSIHYCHRYSGAKLREIGERFMMSDAAVWQASRRVKQKAERDKVLKEMTKRVEHQLGILNVEI
jgi:putative transposase